MNNQFTDLSIPDPDIEYYCIDDVKSKKFTYLMKLVLMANVIDINVIKDYVQNNPQEINKVNEQGWSALMLACGNYSTYSNKECVKLLLDAGADLHVLDRNGETALMITCKYLSVDKIAEIIKLLPPNTIYPDHTNYNNQTILNILLSKHKIDDCIDVIYLIINITRNKTIANIDRFYFGNGYSNPDTKRSFYECLSILMLNKNTKSARKC